MKKFKNGIHYAYVPLYRVAITFSSSKKIMCNQYGEDEIGNSRGLCFYDIENANVGIFIEVENHKPKYNSTLAHECFHAAMAIAEMVDLQPTRTANEEIAYLISWIVEWIEECLEKERKVNNDKQNT